MSFILFKIITERKYVYFCFQHIKLLKVLIVSINCLPHVIYSSAISLLSPLQPLRNIVVSNITVTGCHV
uniref:Uncharacterized protein n=1 Tax=uncultured Nitrospirae bacterium MY4-5C TaxID=798580 RepID=D9MP83_9BACT|nr:hypothetical protein LW5_0140 [uncultured Nitrospirae bacterium MY4-5C]